MADLTNRDDLEARLTRLLGKAGREATQAVIDALGDPPSLDALTPELMAQLEEIYSGVLVPEIEKTFLAGAEAAVAEIGIGVDWALVNSAAQDFARNYGFDLVRGITDTSRQQLQTAISTFFETGTTNAQLQEQIAQIFSAQRSSTIAITEVTRAAVEGDRAIAREIERNGLKLVAVYHTAADSHVCPICGPLDGKRSTDLEFRWPPTHPRCRCWVSHEPVTI